MRTKSTIETTPYENCFCMADFVFYLRYTAHTVMLYHGNVLR